MATYRPVPAKIATVDHIGISTAQSELLIKRAELELSKIEGQVQRGNLKQGVRRVDIGDNVEIQCNVTFDLKEAIVVIGAKVESRTSEKDCYCCSPCLVAGLIVAPETTELIDDEEVVSYREDADYYADVVICQAESTQLPKKVTLHETRSSSGISIYKERVLSNSSHGGEVMLRAIYSDYQRHEVGDTVLVLIQPLYEFAGYPGFFVPCINERKVADGAVYLPEIEDITLDYVNSSGFSCQLAMDKQVWDESIDPPGTGEWKFYPFRILPIKIESCL